MEFAVALWDVKAQKLLLARDISGEKPLFYSELGDGQLAFSSEAQSPIKFSRAESSTVKPLGTFRPPLDP